MIIDSFPFRSPVCHNQNPVVRTCKTDNATSSARPVNFTYPVLQPFGDPIEVLKQLIVKDSVLVKAVAILVMGFMIDDDFDVVIIFQWLHRPMAGIRRSRPADG
ncbi:MAG: hypothetical protein ACK58J_11435 [Planctomyces sp.]